MTKQNITAWFFEGGSVTIPKRLLGLMEPLGLTFDDLGKMVYLLYCGTDQIKSGDQYAQEAARTLHAKGLVHWFTDTQTVDFSPMFDKISRSLGEAPEHLAYDTDTFTSTELNYAQMAKNIERELGHPIGARDQYVIQEVVQKYSWSYELVQELYLIYQRKYKREKTFDFFCKMAYGAQVQNKESMKAFLESQDKYTYKTREVLRRLGKYNNPSEPQKEMYLKWSGLWKFSHEMILLAVEETSGADNPSFEYLDRILENWMKDGITTPEALQAEKQRRRESPKESLSAKIARAESRAKSSGIRKGAIPTYDTKLVDLDFLER